MAHLVLHKGHDPSICDTGGFVCWLGVMKMHSSWALFWVSISSTPHSLLSCAPEGTVAWSSFI